MAQITARVISQRGICEAGHKVGDEFAMGETTPQGMCSWAFYTLFPFTETIKFGGRFPWEEDGMAIVACPDPANPVVFELRRR